MHLCLPSSTRSWYLFEHFGQLTFFGLLIGLSGGLQIIFLLRVDLLGDETGFPGSVRNHQIVKFDRHTVDDPEDDSEVKLYVKNSGGVILERYSSASISFASAV